MRLFTRNGHDWAGCYPAIPVAAAALHARSFLIDGEAVVADAGASLRLRGRTREVQAFVGAFDLRCSLARQVPRRAGTLCTLRWMEAFRGPCAMGRDFGQSRRHCRHVADDLSDDGFCVIQHFLPFDQQSQQVFGVVDYKGEAFNVEAGLGFGLTGSSDHLVMKLMLSRDLNKPPAR